MAKMIHVMLRAQNEARSVDFYHRAFGFEVVRELDFESFKLVYLQTPESDMQLELTVNKDRQEPYDLGNGYGHIALVESDLDSLHQRLLEQGFTPKDIKTFAPEGRLVARFFFIKDPDGYEVEVIEESEHYR